MADCLIASGCNQGNCRQVIEEGYRMLAQLPRTSILASSAFFATAPVGLPGASPRFLNGCVRIQTALSADDIIAATLRIERELGRDRQNPTQARSIDLDVLLYENEWGPVIRHDPLLQLPHPRMSFRRFVLVPAAQIAPSMVHPICHMTVADLLAHLNDCPQIIVLQFVDQSFADRFVAQAGSPSNVAPWPDIHRCQVRIVRASDWETSDRARDDNLWTLVVAQPNDRFAEPRRAGLLMNILTPSSAQAVTNDPGNWFRGPIWTLYQNAVPALIEQVATAIQSMRPPSVDVEQY